LPSRIMANVDVWCANPNSTYSPSPSFNNSSGVNEVLRSLIFSRMALISASFTIGALLPQSLLPRTKLSTAAISSSFNVSFQGSIVLLNDLPETVMGPVHPFNTIRIIRFGDGLATQSDPASGGNCPGMPKPVG